MEKKKLFNLRSFTSFSLIISTLVMSWSGFILYVAPPGRIANWGDWKLMLFTKAEWQALHTIFSYLFFILAIIHLFFVNWKTFLTYLKSKISSGLNKKWELLAAIFVSVIFFAGTLQSWTPFGPVMAFGEKAKESWESEYTSPPVAHMEEYTLTELAANFQGSTPEELQKVLTDSSIVVSGTDLKLKTIAEQNKVTPLRIYEILTNRYSNKTVTDISRAPSGVGRLTLNQIAGIFGSHPEQLISFLQQNKVEATAETTMRTLAEKMGMSPHELYGILYSGISGK